MGIFDYDEVITAYSLKQAIEDGVLVEISKNCWGQLSGGKPIVATNMNGHKVWVIEDGAAFTLMYY